jgi:hypothetical protein
MVSTPCPYDYPRIPKEPNSRGQGVRVLNQKRRQTRTRARSAVHGLPSFYSLYAFFASP